jgi:ABC-type nickel/cobalt efflux system permease component RcnA
MKNIISLVARCLNAALWSLGLSSVVLVLMLGFYICWTQPVSKTVNVDLAEKTVKPQANTKSSLLVTEKRSVYAGL